MRRKHVSVINQCKNFSNSDEEIDVNSSKPDDMALTSTPIKVKERKSVSLLDLSDIDSNLAKSKTHVSSDTIGSSSSICKDSGYNNSESSLSSDKVKEDGSSFPINFREEYFRLLEELKFKNVMISSLHESNYSLRMKIAEAENKIFELRLKSESHCKCCLNQSPASLKTPETKNPFEYTLSPLAKSEPCLLMPPPSREFRANAIRIIARDEPAALSSENSFIKVKQWQKSYKECQKRIVRNISPTVPIPPAEMKKVYYRPTPEPLPQTMSYMETSRALAETYRRRQEKSPDLFSFQVIGDHSVAVSPVRVPQGCHITEDARTYTEFEKRKCETQTSRMETRDESPVKQSILSNILFRNQELLGRSTILDTIPLQRFQTHSPDTKSSGLYDCLTKANEYAASLAVGLSKLPNALDEIRSLSNQMK